MAVNVLVAGVVRWLVVLCAVTVVVLNCVVVGLCAVVVEPDVLVAVGVSVIGIRVFGVEVAKLDVVIVLVPGELEVEVGVTVVGVLYETVDVLETVGFVAVGELDGRDVVVGAVVVVVSVTVDVLVVVTQGTTPLAEKVKRAKYYASITLQLYYIQTLKLSSKS